MGYKVEEGDALRDREAILQLWDRNFGHRHEDRFAWMYEQNPTGVPDTWFLLDTSGEKVGAVSVCKRKFILQGVEATAGQAIDFVIDQEHRSLGPALKMQRLLIAEMPRKGWQFLYGFPNDKSLMVQERAGFVRLDRFPHWRIVLRSGQGLERRFNNVILAKAASYLVDVGLRMRYDYLGPKLPTGLTVRTSTEIPPGFGGTGQVIQVSQRAVGDRCREYLEWRFFQHQATPYNLFTLEERGDLNGYVIYTMQEGRVTISDFLAVSPARLRLLLVEFMRKMWQDKALSIVIHFLGSGEWASVLQSLGFSEKAIKDYIVMAMNPALQGDALLLPDAWHITHADRDV